ncbi:CHAT domain-containing protein [Bradyrhizobium sp. CSA112]|uniref:CHAT domain-containing tetratricopeptide repeat protein n=1 Tax=Bradyrhizobium sp. CSA112 TaxID=2699170 RepID=UPI00319DE744
MLAVTAPAAQALSVEAAQESCRMTVGRPIVQACMRASGGAGNLEACRAKAFSPVRACVMAALDKANGRANVAVAIPTEAAPKVAPGSALPAGFVAPPRTITDITAILDSEKADLKTIEELKAEADAKPTGKESREDLAQFYFDRGNARAQLGRLADSIADANKAIEVGRGAVSALLMGRLISLAAQQYSAAGDPKKAFELYQRLLRETSNQKGARGFLYGANRAIAGFLIQMGDIAQAEAYLRRSQPQIQEFRTTGHPVKREAYNNYGQNWEAEIELGRAMLFEARGQFREAEASFKLGELRRRAGIKGLLGSEHPPSESSLVLAVDFTVLSQARVKARQGRFAEAEVDARRALLSQLKNQGKYSPVTPRFIGGLADILVGQGRYVEAEQLARVSLEIARTVGVAEDSLSNVQLLSQLGGILNLQRKGRDAIAVFAQIDNAIAKWEPARREAFELNGGRISSLYASGQLEAGIAAAEQLVKKQISRVGENHFDTASARGTLAIGLMRAGRDQDAIREFRAAIPILMASSRENADDDNTTAVAARSQRLQGIVEAYLNMLAREKNASGDVGTETFSLADAIRGRSVQQALAASSARASAKDPALAELVRKEQDLGKQVNAQLGTLTNVLSLPSHERDEKGVQAINASINALRADRTKARQEISRRFPAYADLISPKPPSVEQIKATLADGEAMLSFYFGQTSSFVWAVPKNGPVAFAAIKATSGDLESKVRKLREALEPQAAMISDIPPFDLKLAHELYSLLLQPVESGWKPARNLILVTNGALGLLPLSLLPTAPAEIRSDDDPLFASYKDVPWLARTHAVTTVPSAAALRTLRQLPPGKPGRGELIAFGDPYFSKEQEAEADNADKVRVADASGNTTRGGPLKRRNSPKLDGVDSAELAMLPRLPDTSDELKSIALALQADPSKVLNLGKQASEQAVKTMDLSGFKVLAFATHGLVPGELNGLSQPALALSSPTVTGGEGDGLLTMEEILGLKLDADWVVLSACNTGTGAGAGAEAASGLGRAFFYAGTRALLVTNWSVHSQSARKLVTDLFRRQAQDPKLTRGEALRQAMMALADGPGYAGADGKTEFAYGHPLFWAPYTIIGDGGVR